jgi:hypothetical protein
MTKLSDYSARAVGIPWVREKDYVAFLRIIKDADKMPRTWKEFNQRSEEGERAYQAKGYIVVRAYINPDTFGEWCAANDCGVDTHGRIKFAASVAAEKHGGDAN